MVFRKRLKETRHLVLFLLALGFLSLGLQAQSSQEQISRIWAVNASQKILDLRLGEDGIFVANNLGAYTASQMLVLKSFKARALYIRESGTEAWSRAAPLEQDLYRLKAKQNYCIFVDAELNVSLHELSADQNTDKPQVSVFNTSHQSVKRLVLGTAWDGKIVAQAKNLSPGWTNFLSVDEGNWAGFWSYATMPEQISHYYTSGSDGISLGLYPFKKGSWYLFILWDEFEGTGSGGMIWDISP